MSLPLTVSSTPPALPITSLSRVLSVNVFSWPRCSSPWNSSWPVVVVTCTQLRSVARTATVTLPRGAWATALSSPDGVGDAGALVLGGALVLAARVGDVVPATAGAGERLHEAVGDDQDERSSHRRAPVGAAAALLPGRGLGLEDLGGAGRRSLRPGRVELGEQRRRVQPDRDGDGAQVAAGVEVAAAGRVVVVLDAHDEGAADPGRPRRRPRGRVRPSPAPRRGSCRWTPCSFSPSPRSESPQSRDHPHCRPTEN